MQGWLIGWVGFLEFPRVGTPIIGIFYHFLKKMVNVC
jgi:hypothetical protein